MPTGEGMKTTFGADSTKSAQSVEGERRVTTIKASNAAATTTTTATATATKKAKGRRRRRHSRAMRKSRRRGRRGTRRR